MTSNENTLALYLVRECFGETAKSIASLLLRKNGYPFFLIAEDSKIEKRKLAQVLSILITHHLVEYKLNNKQIVEYKFNALKSIERLKIPRSINLIKSFYGNDKDIESIISEIIMHGSLEMSSVLLKLTVRKFNSESELKAKSGDLGEIHSHFKILMTAFNRLVEDKFIERLPRLRENVTGDDSCMQTNANVKSIKSKVPNFMDLTEHEATKDHMINLNIEAERIKKSVDEDLGTVTSRIRRENENFGDNGICWKMSEKKVAQYFRDEALIEALSNRIDQNAGNILRVIFKLADEKILDKAAQNSFVSKPVTAMDIQRVMRNDHKMDTLIVDKYLSVILQDSFKMLEKIGDFSGGAYCIDFRKALTNLCLAHIESYVRERYDSKSLRIFRVIVEKLKVEQKQIEDFSMIPSKECKALVYNMLNDGLLSIIELSKTSDHAPSRTYYLFYVDVFHVTKKLLENSYKSIKNLLIKREQLITENRRLLDKNTKINNRVELLVSQGAEQTEIDYEKSIMSTEETNKLNSFTGYCNKIELAEIQLEETIFVFETFFYYNTVAPVIPVKSIR